MGDKAGAGMLAIVAAGLVLFTGAYTRMVRPRMARWGATEDEVTAAMPGDDEVAGRRCLATPRCASTSNPDWTASVASVIGCPR